MKLTSGETGGLRYSLHTKGRGGPFFYYPVHGETDLACERMAQLVSRYAPGKAFTLVAFACGNWNRDYSPYPVTLPGGEVFAGEGPRTLTALRESLIPAVEGEASPLRGIGGYSLAGLFSLWAGCETELFAGIAACSASLWYPGWEAYRQTHAPQAQAVYLSLGDKEEHTRHPVMSRVGDALRAEYQSLTATPALRAQLVFHPGGHGSQGDVRMAQGFAWLLTELQ